MHPTRTLWIRALATLLFALCARGDEKVVLVPADNDFSDYFGRGIAVRGSTALIGATGESQKGLDAGAAYLFDLTTGAELAKFIPKGAGTKDDYYFGSAVGLTATVALVGAPGGDLNGYESGMAYLFDLASGKKIAELTPADGDAYQRFGAAVAVDGATAILGAPEDDDLGLESGSVYLFDAATGQELAKLLASDGWWYDWFGYSVAISGATAVVGAPGDNDLGPNTGAVYVFDVTTGQELRKLVPSDGGPSQYFGRAVAISGTTVLVGSPGQWDTYDGGSAYLFDLSTGQELAKLVPGESQKGDGFGGSVALEGDTAVVGAAYYDNPDSTDGVAYLFDASTGAEILELLPEVGKSQGNFGQAVGLVGSTVVVGAPLHNPTGNGTGAAYLFDVPGPVGTAYCGPANPNSSGQSAVLSGWGTEAVAQNLLELSASQMPADKFGMVLNSRSTGFSTPPGSQGNLCLSGAIGRYSKSVLDTGSGGQFSLLLDLDDTPTPTGPVVIQPGETWYFQVWFRDFVAQPTSNFTDGLSVTFQ